jgi:succinate-semialdehyde dehydrogenase
VSPKDYVLSVIDRARDAQRVFEGFSQRQVDEAVRAIGKAVFDNGEMLARLAVDETGMGRYEDKIVKNRGKSKAVWNKLKGVSSRGVVRTLDDEGLIEVAKPIGVIGAISPTTNPTITPMHNAMIALKGGNAIVVCPHPRAKETGRVTVELMRQALVESGAPADLVQIVPEPTVEISGLVMQLCDACISTGGPGMVKAAYSSGKPAFGVGAGNVQCIVDADVSVDDVAAKIARGRTYDNGILCTCEQSAICPSTLYDAMVSSLRKLGAHYIDRPAEVDALRETMFAGGSINKDVVGASAVAIARTAGIEVPETTEFLLVAISGSGEEELLAKEKLCPVLVIYRYDTWEQAIGIAAKNLYNEGTGHSAVVHSNDRRHILYASERLPVSRIGVNMVGSSGLGGGFDNGLNPAATLGCGSWGNNSISENLWWHHLVNTSRVAATMPGRRIPTDAEVWG